MVFLVPFAFCAENAALVIVLERDFFHRGGEMMLLEAASIDGEPSLVAIAAKARLLPKDGVLTRAMVLEALLRIGLAGTRVALRMPEQVRVLSEDPVTADVRRLSRWVWRLDVEREGSLPSGAVLVSPREIKPGTAATVLRYRLTGGREFSVPVRIKWRQPAAVLRRSLPRGSILAEEDLRILFVERSGLRTPADPFRLQGTRLTRNLAQGGVVFTEDVESVPVIAKGDPVRILFRTGGLQVEASGEALDNGGIGESIRVRNVLSRRIISCIVSGPGMVIVEEE
jgi:flagella basal body P-ring formation protein FlgA